MLLSMLREKSTKVSLKNGRIFLQCKDGTAIMDVLIDNVCKYAMRKNKRYYQFILAIHGIWYKIVIAQ